MGTETADDLKPEAPEAPQNDGSPAKIGSEFVPPDKKSEVQQKEESPAGRDNESSKGKNKPAATTEKKAAKEESASKESDKPAAPRTSQDDRRWIIKMSTPKEKRSNKQDVKQIVYKDDKHKTSCERDVSKLRELFVKARQNSIKGDHCGTARDARSFLNLAETCKKECPAELLEQNGFSETIIRNFKLLHQLGSERCLR